MQETQEIQVQSLSQEDALEEGMVAHSSIFAWRIPWTGEPGRLQSMGLQRVRYDWCDLAHNPVPGTRGVEKCLLNELKNKTMERNSTDDYKLQLDTKVPVLEYFSLLSLIYLG